MSRNALHALYVAVRSRDGVFLKRIAGCTDDVPCCVDVAHALQAAEGGGSPDMLQAWPLCHLLP